MPATNASDPQLIDLRHLGRERVIGCWRVGDVLVDPGPSSCLEHLLEQLGSQRPRVLALTHIHLDHAGATGSLLGHFDDLEVWVHERGAPHLIDPARLVHSARRLYGDRMDELWGEVAPVPARRMRVLQGGETLDGFGVAYTPGHASHHVCYLHKPSGFAFAGDVTGVRIGAGPVLAPTPPPDIDLEAWHESLALVQAWRPRALAITHFGLYDDVREHIAAVRAELTRTLARAGELDEHGFETSMRAEVAGRAGAATQASYEQALPPDQSYRGLRRYLDTRSGSTRTAGAGAR